MAGVYQQDTSHDATLRATLDVTDKDGHTVRKRFTLSRVGSFGNGKTLVRFTDPPELRGVTLLSINEPGVTDRQWIYTPATERVRSVAPRERSERFAGSDFTYEDIAERSLDDFTYQPLPAEDIIENHKTFKILAVPKGLGGLLQTAIRRPGTCAPLPRPLYPSRGHLQSSPDLLC